MKKGPATPGAAKTSLEAQNMKTGPEVLGTIENGPRRPQYHRK
jgi:hypothetical protein